MPIYGAGLTPIASASSVVGYGSIETTTIIRPSLFVKSSGFNGDCRFINPNTGDFEIDENGKFVGGDSIQQSVYLALFTVKNSSAVQNFGQSFSNIETLNENYKIFVENEIKKALKYLTDNKKISIENIDVVRNNDRIRISISWKNLITNTDFTQTIG